jgi:tetratricopeptide (TPR) repeat protein
MKGLIDGPWKLIQAPRPELYDLKNDPREEHDLFEKAPSVSRAMVKKLQETVKANSRPSPTPQKGLSTEDQEQLRSLGYLGGDWSDAPGDRIWPDPKDKIEDYLLYYRGNLMEGEGRLDAALDCYREVLRKNPDVPPYYVTLGFLLMKMDRTNEAIELLEAARSRFPTSVLVLSRLMSFSLKAERWEVAVAAAEGLLDRQPGDFDALFLSGSAFAKLGKWEDALDHYGKALKIEPENKTLRHRYSYALAAVGRYEEALGSYRRLKEEYPGDYSFDLDVGQIYATMGQPAKAREAYHGAAQRFPCADTFHAYAMFLGGIGEFREAVRWLKAYLDLADEKDAPRKKQAETSLAAWEKKIKN